MMCCQGRQEDAEEYLGFILNGLHEEMLALKKLISPQEESKRLSQTLVCHLAQCENLSGSWKCSIDE